MCIKLKATLISTLAIWNYQKKKKKGQNYTFKWKMK